MGASVEAVKIVFIKTFILCSPAHDAAASDQIKQANTGTLYPCLYPMCTPTHPDSTHLGGHFTLITIKRLFNLGQTSHLAVHLLPLQAWAPPVHTEILNETQHT